MKKSNLLIVFGIVLCGLLAPLNGFAQDCTLDISGKNTEVIIKIFQLNEEQKIKMEELRAKLETTTKTVEEDIQKLFNQHPQSTPEELTTLAGKYRALQKKMVEASFSGDEKLLATFNEKQYQRYLDLCAEALRDPIKIIPVVLKDSIPPK